MKKIIAGTLFIASSLFSVASSANIEVLFVESAPKDTFVIKNIGACSLKNFSVEIDLSTSVGRLIFDVTNQGAGVEVFQPFEIVQGDFSIENNQTVKDGDQQVLLNIAELLPNNTVSFTIDVDDNLTNSELGNIQVMDSEIRGATINTTIESSLYSGTFVARNRANVSIPSC